MWAPRGWGTGDKGYLLLCSWEALVILFRDLGSNLIVGGFRKKGDKNQETIQSSTTPDPGYHMGK